jgi:phage tail protein X
MLNFCGIVATILKMASGIADIEQFLPVAIFKISATIPQIFNIVRYHQNLMWVDNDVPN